MLHLFLSSSTNPILLLRLRLRVNLSELFLFYLPIWYVHKFTPPVIRKELFTVSV